MTTDRVSAIDPGQQTGRAIWAISGPVMLSTVLFTFMTTVDMFWVGKLGSLEIAAVSLAGSVIGVFQAVAGIISTGTLATCARFAGANDRNRIRESMFHSLLLITLVSLLLAAASAPFSNHLLRIFGAEPTVVALGTPYLLLSLIVLPFFFISTVLAAGFQALGDTRTPMWISFAANIANLVLNPFRIFGWAHFPRLGVLGAAIATALSQLVGMLVLFQVLRRRGFIQFHIPVRPAVFRTLLAIGAPASLQAITRPLTGMLLFRIVAAFGSAAIAGFGVGLRILNIMYIYLSGLGTACQTLVGQNLGAHRPEAAVRVADRVLRIALLLQVGVLVLMFLFAPGVVRIFNTSPDVVRHGTSYLRVLSPFLVLLGLSTAWSGAQFGAGDTRPTMLAAIIANWLVKLPLSYILSRMSFFNVTGIWFGIGFSILVETLIVGIAYFRGGWRRKEIQWQSS